MSLAHQLQRDFVPAWLRRAGGFQLDAEVALPVTHAFRTNTAKLSAKSRPGNDIRFHALEERHQVAPAALGVASGPEAFVL
jgi:hypothetical protein